MAINALAIVWYNESEYDHCKTLFSDSDTLPDSWHEWKTQAAKKRAL